VVDPNASQATIASRGEKRGRERWLRALHCDVPRMLRLCESPLELAILLHVGLPEPKARLTMAELTATIGRGG
jgi:hypothetical protein